MRKTISPEPPSQKKRKRLKLIVNTNHCRGELDTVQYVIDRNGFKETNQPGEGTLQW